jgi:hypothetical protein
VPLARSRLVRFGSWEIWPGTVSIRSEPQIGEEPGGEAARAWRALAPWMEARLQRWTPKPGRCSSVCRWINRCTVYLLGPCCALTKSWASAGDALWIPSRLGDVDMPPGGGGVDWPGIGWLPGATGCGSVSGGGSLCRKWALLARGHGTFNVAGGLWCLLHVSCLEWVVGPEGGLLACLDGRWPDASRWCRAGHSGQAWRGLGGWGWGRP